MVLVVLLGAVSVRCRCWVSSPIDLYMSTNPLHHPSASRRNTPPNLPPPASPPTTHQPLNLSSLQPSSPTPLQPTPLPPSKPPTQASHLPAPYPPALSSHPPAFQCKDAPDAWYGFLVADAICAICSGRQKSGLFWSGAGDFCLSVWVYPRKFS